MVEVINESKTGEPIENCCFCRRETTFWYQKQIACCKDCASRANKEDMPTKAQWIRRERIAQIIFVSESINFSVKTKEYLL